MGEQFGVGWMIDRLDADDAFRQIDVVVLDVGLECCLGVPGPCDEDLANSGQRLGDLIEETMIVGGVTTADGSGLVVNTLLRLVTPDVGLGARLAGIGDDSGVSVIEPQNCVSV